MLSGMVIQNFIRSIPSIIDGILDAERIGKLEGAD